MSKNNFIVWKPTLHKVSDQLVKDNQVIVIEDLNVKGMIKNKKLSKHIADESWGNFVNLLQYKCDGYGRFKNNIGRDCRLHGWRLKSDFFREAQVCETRSPFVFSKWVIHKDNANRSFLIYLDESKEQDKRIMEYQRKLSAGKVNEEQAAKETGEIYIETTLEDVKEVNQLLKEILLLSLHIG